MSNKTEGTLTYALFEQHQAGIDYHGIHTFKPGMHGRPEDTDPDEWEENDDQWREEQRLYVEYNCGHHWGMSMRLVELYRAKSMSWNVSRDLRVLKKKGA